MDKILRVEKIRKEFGGLVAVDDVSFDVSAGEIFGIIGPNGAGKTTMFNLITGVYPVTSGRTYFQDSLITGKHVYQIAALGISRTFQNLKLLGGQTVLDNVMLGQHTKISSNFLASAFRLKREQEEEERALEYCMDVLRFVGLDSRWDVPAGSLPYGDQRLLEIARALCTQPSLIFLDEPAAGMNSNETGRLTELIYKIREKGVTPVVIEHDMKLIMGICENIIVLEHGALICQGDPEKVKNDPRVIEAYLGREVDEDA